MDSVSGKHRVYHLSLSSPALIGLIISVALPWIIVGVIVFCRPVKSDNDATAELPHHTIESGAWGFLDISRITIQPPLSFIASDINLASYRQWTFSNASLESIQQQFRQAGLAEEDVKTLSGSAVNKPEIKGYIIQPRDDLVGRMSTQVRSALYARLSLESANIAQANPYRFCGSSVYEWFYDSRVSPEIVEKIKPLIYKRGKYLLFSDLQLVLKEAKSVYERTQLLRTLLRASTLKIRVRGNSQNIDSILDYWSRGNRRNEVEPLMVSLAEQTQNTSIVLLLPAFARTRLYTYCIRTAKDKDGMRDCHWTSFNFFNATPDERFANPSMIPDIIAKEYAPVPNPMFLGDIVLISNGSGAIIHSCVYIADDVVFSKNGCAQGDPFLLEKLEDVVDFYQQLYGSVKMSFIRRKDTFLP